MGTKASAQKAWITRKNRYGSSGFKEPLKAWITRRERYGPTGIRDPLEYSAKMSVVNRVVAVKAWITRREKYGESGIKDVDQYSEKCSINSKLVWEARSVEQKAEIGAKISKQQLEYYQTEEGKEKSKHTKDRVFNNNPMKSSINRMRMRESVIKGYQNGREAWNKGKTKENSEYGKYMSKVKKQWILDNPERYAAVLGSLQRGQASIGKSKKLTRLEKWVKDVLEQHGLINDVDFFYNATVATKIGNRFPDFLLPHEKLVIEADGYRHGETFGKWLTNKKDLERATYIAKEGYLVLSVCGIEIEESPETTKQAIINTIEFCRRGDVV